MPIGPGFLFLYVDQRLSRAQNLQFIAERSFGMLGSEQIGVGLAQQVPWVFEAEQGCHGTIYRNKAALSVLEVYAVRQTIHQRLQEKTLVCERILHPVALAHVPGDAGHSHWLSLL